MVSQPQIDAMGAECMAQAERLERQLHNLHNTSFTKAEILLNEVHHGLPLTHFRSVLARARDIVKRNDNAMFTHKGEPEFLSSAAGRLAAALNEAEKFDVT